MDLLYQGVVDGRITLERWVELCCTTPARMFGLYGSKGVIAPGADADLVVYDPQGRTHISVDTHHMNMDHSAWEGYEIAGHVDTVVSRGRVVIDDGNYLGAKGHGQFVKRGLSQYLPLKPRQRSAGVALLHHEDRVGVGGADPVQELPQLVAHQTCAAPSRWRGRAKWSESASGRSGHAAAAC